MKIFFLKIKSFKRIVQKPFRFIRYNKYLLRLLNRPLHEFRYNIHSQNGEDGVIEEIFKRIGIKGGWVVEFGAWNGVHLSNTLRLLEMNDQFRAVYIEGDTDKYDALEREAKSLNNRIVPINAYVQASNDNSLENILNRTPTPDDFELLSIDVDGQDYQIWEKFEGYRPKVVIIEINSSIPHHIEQIHGPEGQSSSFRSMLYLGIRKGYTCVCHTGNMFFIRNDFVSKLHLQDRYLKKPELFFLTKWL